MHLRILESRPDLTVVHYSGARGCWATSGREILTRDDEKGAWTRFGSFPRQGPSDWIGLGRLPRRLLRLDKCNLWPTCSGRVMGIRGGHVYRYERESHGPPVPLFEIRGDCVMSRAIAEDADGNVYFGEYFMNRDRTPVRIWRIDARLERWSTVYHFEDPRIRHLHGIHADPYDEKRMWVTMGDFEGECFLGYTDDRFETLQLLGDGSQTWRAVGLLFKRDAIGWLTDTHIEQNYVVSMRRGTEQPILHAQRDASSWYTAETREGIFLATTTVEPGPGIQTDRVRLLASRDAVDWMPVVEFQKDRLPMLGFGFGSLSLPAGDLSANGFWLSGEAIMGLDGQSIFCAIEWET